MVFAVAGLGIWVDEGGKLDKAAMEDDASLHRPRRLHRPRHQRDDPDPAARVSLLLIVSFFAKVPGGVKWAAIVSVRSWCRCSWASSAMSRAYVGMLHGLNAFVLLGAALMRARRRPRRAAERLARPSADHRRLRRRRAAARGSSSPSRRRSSSWCRWRVLWQASRMPGSYSSWTWGTSTRGGGPVPCDGGHDMAACRHGQRRRPRRGHRPAGRRRRRADRRAGHGQARVRPRGRRLHLQRPAPGPAHRGDRGRPARGARAQRERRRTASACTGTVSTSRTPRTASPASPRTPSARARTRLPVRRRRRRHLLVPLPPGLPHPGAARPLRPAGRRSPKEADDRRRRARP